MSITSMTDRFTITLERESETTDASGGSVSTWSTGNRGALPTSVRADMQTLDAEGRVEYGVMGTSIAWCMYTGSDPELLTQDRVTWTDNSGVSRTCRVKNPSFDMAGRNKVWLTVVQEKEAWT